MISHDCAVEVIAKNDSSEGNSVPDPGPGAFPRYLRRQVAARYIRERWGLPCEPSWLAKLAVTGGGPIFRKAGRFPVYEIAALDSWASTRLSAPMRSTSDESGKSIGRRETEANSQPTTAASHMFDPARESPPPPDDGEQRRMK